MKIGITFVAAVAILASEVLIAAEKPAEPVAQGGETKLQSYLLPIDVKKIEATALAELLKQRPDLKAEDLKFSGLTYSLVPEPDYAIQQMKDGSEKRVFVSENYQELSVMYLVLSSKREADENDKPAIVHDAIFVNFPNGRGNAFHLSKGQSTRYVYPLKGADRAGK